MRVLIKISHPAHVHFYKYFINEMISKGHEIKVLTTPKKSAVDLLEHYGVPYYTYSLDRKIDFLKLRAQLKLNLETLKIAKKFNADVLTAIGGTSIAHASRFLDTKSIIFTDTEHAKFQNNITFPFADYIYTPECFFDDLGSKQIRYPGYHELAYLHPNRFTPDPSVLDYIGADKDDKIVILRLVSWEAAHDVGHGGFGDVVDVVNRIESTGAKVIITSEGDIPKGIEHCQYSLPPHKMHDLMYYSSLYIGEGGTMAIESAVLGTPAIFVSSLSAGVIEELDSKYGLLFNYSGEDKEQKGLLKSLEILENYDNNKWMKKKQKLLKDKIDVTEFMIKVFEKYENS